MTNRERWIIYPLLFYALAMGFKANYFSPLEFRCQSIACRKLSVTEAIDTNVLHVRVLNGLAPQIDWSAAMKAAADAVRASSAETHAPAATPEQSASPEAESPESSVDATSPKEADATETDARTVNPESESKAETELGPDALGESPVVR